MTRNDPSKYIIAPTPVYIYHMNPPYIYIYMNGIYTRTVTCTKNQKTKPHTHSDIHITFIQKKDMNSIRIVYK